MIARGQRQGVPPPFAPAGSLSRDPVATTPRHRARGPPGRRPAKIAMESVLGRPTIPSPDMLLGQRSDPASPAVNQAPHPARTDQGDW